MEPGPVGGHSPSFYCMWRLACLHSALQFCKLLYKIPPSPLLEKRKFVHSKMKQPFIDSQPRFLLLQAACQGPGGNKENAQCFPWPIPGQSLCTHPWGGGEARLLSPWGVSICLSRSFSNGHFHLLISGGSEVHGELGVPEHSLCNPFPLPCLPPGVKVATHASSPSTQLH